MNLDNVKMYVGKDSLILETDNHVYFHQIDKKGVLRVSKEDLNLDSTSTDQEAALARKIQEMEREFDTQVVDLRKMVREGRIEDEEQEHLRPRPETVVTNYYSQYFNTVDWNTVVIVGLLILVGFCVLAYLYS